MKKSFSKSVLVVLVMLVMASGAIFAETDSMVITAQIDTSLSVAIAETLDLGVLTVDSEASGSTDLTLGANTFYDLSVASYIGSLKLLNAAGTDYVDESDSTVLIPYTLSYKTISNETVPTTGLSLVTHGGAISGSDISAITIKATSAAEDLGGSYKDTLTFTITAN